MFSAFLTLFGSVMGIVDQEIKTKYIDKYMALKQEYENEINKPDGSRDDSVLDALSFQLCNLGLGLAADVGKPIAGTQP